MATGLTIDSQNDAMNTNRYQAQNLKTTSAKRVPYEELDFSVYKPTAIMVAFSTSEQRMPLWIRVMKLRYENGLQNNITSSNPSGTKLTTVTTLQNARR